MIYMLLKRFRLALKLFAMIFTLSIFMTGCSDQPAKTTTSNQISAANDQKQSIIPSPVVIFYLPDDILRNSKVVPQYEGPNINPAPLITREEWEKRGGHQPWRADPFMVAKTLTMNLVPENISSKANMVANWEGDDTVKKNKDGIVMKKVKQDASSIVYDLIVPHLGKYEITLQDPQKSVFYIITKIVFYPNPTK